MRNTIPSYIIFIFIILASAGIALLPHHHAQAAQKSTGSSDPASIKPLIIPTDLALQWKGHFTLGGESVIHRPYHRGLSTTIAVAITGVGSPKGTRDVVFSFNPSAVYSWIVANTASYNISPHEPALTIANDRVTAFEPPQNGQIVDAYASMERAMDNLERGDYNITPVININPSRKSLSDLNNLGIKELISRGESSFPNSPSNRRHNIKIGVEKMTGVIIKPGEEFSFNKYLGPVEAYAGFLPELVIKADKGTVPELGGGLCQVSSTTFRAAMHAGLPITQRRNHSYAVSYYAPQGTDATIYPGVIDLKFVNDTPGSILIWPYFTDANSLIFDFYGTRDDRQVILKDPVTFDRQSNGAMKASWTRTVIKDGVTETKTFSSNYLPPALFHKETKFVPASGTEAPTTNNSPVTNTPPNSSPSSTIPATPTPTPVTQ